jgi:hypothetical protein
MEVQAAYSKPFLLCVFVPSRLRVKSAAAAGKGVTRHKEST